MLYKAHPKVAVVCLFGIIIFGCSTQFQGINDDLYKDSEELANRLKLLKEKIEQLGDVSEEETFATLGVSKDRCSPMDWERVRKLVYGENIQVRISVDKIDKWREAQKQYAGCSFFYHKVVETVRPVFSFDGIVGKQNDQRGPEQEMVIIFHHGHGSSAMLYDAGIFGPNDVNRKKTEWIWSLLGKFVEDSTNEGSGKAAKKAMGAF